MSNLELYTILDRATGVNQIMTSPEKTEKAMIRAFEDIVKNNPTINKHREDFVLVKLGKMNQQTGDIEPNYEEIFEASDFYNGETETKKGEELER